ncbi:SDR family NAD(P)-dependent oxidoreductase [Sphingomonas sp. ID1715]|uniref:SDR family NAD(P)-dependent oxidoreductase n=1 Tax=Sphingomonas sp. ID1715 TaxID=1656898 RepID=UPI001488F210|nr:SDR family NAD(P)-dependent oxidoreductase [Sphingomonas sp. ID1715]NNM76012.1 SDR family NAD(P)-dependent oxidoreductase [Sphingomonas sp. ID1715]
MAGFAIVTGASSGIGLELARLAAQDGYDLLLVADTPLVDASSQLKGLGVQVENVEADLSTFEGVDRLLAAARGRPVDLLFANAGHGLGHGFLEQDPAEWRHVIDTNITGTVYLLQKVLREMVARNEGRVLITGSIAGHMAGAFQAVYNGTKAFIDSFADAIVNELKDTNVTVTCLKPGATDTEFFERAGMEDTKVGTAKKDDPDDVAKTGYDALMKGERSVIYGFKNKLQVAAASVLGGGFSAEAHRHQAEPGSGS